MSKSIALGTLGASAILLAILLAGCSDEPSPTPSARAIPSPTVTAQPGVTSAPPATPTVGTHDGNNPHAGADKHPHAGANRFYAVLRGVSVSVRGTWW